MPPARRRRPTYGGLRGRAGPHGRIRTPRKFRYAVVTPNSVTIREVDDHRSKSAVLADLGLDARGTQAAELVTEVLGGRHYGAAFAAYSTGSENSRAWKLVVRLGRLAVPSLRDWVGREHQGAVGTAPRGPVILYAHGPDGPASLSDKQVRDIEAAF